MNNDLMIDLETGSTRANAVILTAGMIKFDRHGDITRLLPHYPTSVEEICSVVPAYYARINTEDAVSHGFRMDKDTIAWWMKQKDEAKYEAFRPDGRIGVDQFLTETFMFAGGTFPWSHGVDFDDTIIDEWYSARPKVILDEWFKARGRETPWQFWNGRCTRTLYDLAGVNEKLFRNKKRAHHALFDCWDQIVAAQAAFRAIKREPTNAFAA